MQKLVLPFNHSNVSDLYFDRRRDLVSKDYVKQTIEEYIMKWHNDLERVNHKLDSVVISYGHTEPLNTIIELKHIYQVFYLGAIGAHMPNSGAVWRRLGLKRDGTKDFQLTDEPVFIVLRVLKQRTMFYLFVRYMMT